MVLSSLTSIYHALLARSFIRYGLMGLCAAGTHAAIALVCRYLLNLSPSPSNMAGFVTGALISYLGSYYFTFKSNAPHRAMLPKFALVWIIGIAVNWGLFSALTAANWLPFEGNVLAAIIITPLAQYILLRFWAFRPDTKSG